MVDDWYDTHSYYEGRNGRYKFNWLDGMGLKYI